MNFGANVAKRSKVNHIVLAHHADDQVGVIFPAIVAWGGRRRDWQGCENGSRRRWPIKRSRWSGHCWIWTKAELLSYAREYRVPFREDASNQSSDFLRNRIRNELLPLLRDKYQPGLAKTVLRLMEIVGAESEIASDMARWWLKHGQGEFAKLPVAVQRRVLQLQLTEAGQEVDFELVEQLRSAADRQVSINV